MSGDDKMPSLQLSDINGMKKDELKKSLIQVLQLNKSRESDEGDTPHSVLAAILEEMKKMNNERNTMMEEISALRQSQDILQKETENMKIELLDEIKSLRMQVKEMKGTVYPYATQEDNSSDQQHTFADVVRNSVRATMESTFKEAESKKELILTKVQEGNDQQFLSELCGKMEVSPQPLNPVRIGRKTDERSRLLKISFQSNFDARKFKARFEQLKAEKKDVPDIRMRLGKTKEEREVYAKNKKVTQKLNNDAKDADFSFSIQENGSIWKFVRGDDGRWKRDKEWSYLGNDESSTKSPIRS